MIGVVSHEGGHIEGEGEVLLAAGEEVAEAGVRVAACMRWTGTIQPECTCETPITSVDFLPTFAKLAGAELPMTQPVDGTDISPLMMGKEIAERSAP